MILFDRLKDMKIYRAPMFLPTLEDDKKRYSAILLLTPNYQSSKALMNHPLTVNRMRFQSYYLQPDVSYYINGTIAKSKKDDTYVRESTMDEMYHNLCEMTASERNRLKDSDFGLPSKRKYPLDSEAHVKSAIRFFNYVSKEDEEELARNIKKKIKEYDMKVNVGKNNRFAKYYTSPVKENSPFYSLGEDSRVVALNSFILFSGYTEDVNNLGLIINPESYLEILREIGLKIDTLDDIPVLSYTVVHSKDEEMECSYNKIENHIRINMEVPAYDPENKEYTFDNYASDIIRITCYSILHMTNRCELVCRIVSEYIANTESYYDDYANYLFAEDDPAHILNTYTDDQIMKKLSEKYRIEKPDESLIEGKTPITVQNLARKFKYMTTTKIKRAASRRSNGIGRLLDKLQNRFSSISINVPTPGVSSAAPSHESSVLESSVFDDINEINTDYVKISDNLITLFEATTTSQLRTALYTQRIKKRSELLLKLKQVKAENPWIKYAYPDFEKYNGKNIFIDLYYYNELYFKNTQYTSTRGYKIYLDLMMRLIQDPRISKGYKKRTIFIPVLDWSKNRETKMWLYRQDINPISILYELMRTNDQRLFKVFAKTPIIFFSQNSYFKLTLDNYKDPKEMKKILFKFSSYIQKMTNNEEFDPEDVDTSYDNNETSEVIKANIYDKIETAKGVDLTGKDKLAHPEANTTSHSSVTVVKKPKPNDKPIKVVSATTKDPEQKPRVEKEPKTTTKEIVKNEVKDKKLSKTANVDDITDTKSDEVKLAKAIDDISQNANSTEDAMDLIDKDQDIKRMIIDLDSVDNGATKVNAARAARMNDLDKKFIESELQGRKIDDILNDESQTKAEIKKAENVKVDSPNKEWDNLHYMNFDKSYDLQKDIVNAFYHFTKVSKPYAIRKMDVKDNSTSEDRLDLYTVEVEDFKGKRYTLKLDIPREKDNRFFLRGNEKTIATQFLNMPIVKTNLGECQIITNYMKIFIRRYNTSTGRSFPISGRLIKALSKYNGNKLKIELGNNTKICNLYHLPIDYIDIAGVISKITTKDGVVYYFNQDEIRAKDGVDPSLGIPYAITKDGTVKYYNIDKSGTITFSIVLSNELCEYDKSLEELYDAAKASSGGTYSRCKVLNAQIPLVLVCAHNEGLSSVLKKAKIIYTLSEKADNKYRKDPRYDQIKFKDGYLYYLISYESCMLLNGMKDMNTEDYSITDIDNKNLYIDSLDNFGSRTLSDGLDNFYDCLIDPITKEVLEHYDLPTDFVSVLLYANALLSDNKFVKHTDTTSRRIRRAESIAAYTYEALSQAYGTYAIQVKHNVSNAVFSIKQSAVIDKLLASPITSDESTINALQDVETTNSISFKGKGGLNEQRSYSLDKRTFDDSMLNVMGMSTSFSASAGISRQATMDMNVEGIRGYIKSIDSDTSQFNAAKTLCATEALTPFAISSDDSQRVYMTFAQTAQHMVRTEYSDPLLVTNGSDEALPYMTTDKFAFKAKEDGTIISVDQDKAIIEYKSGKYDYVNLTNTVQKNSNAGYYESLKEDLAEGLKEGSKVKAGQIVAYDKKSFSNSVGESDNIAYNIGKLAKIAVINTDDGYEDSGVCSERLANKLATKVVMKQDKVLPKNSIIYEKAKVGDNVNVNTPLLIWQEPYSSEDANILAKSMDQDMINEVGRQSLKSDVTGTIVGIKIYRTVELDELSESMRLMVDEYEKPINKLRKELSSKGIDTAGMPATYKLDTTGKLKKAEDAVLVEYYIEYTDIVGIGDKITYYSANKATIHGVIPDKDAPYTDFRPNEKIDALVSTVSINHRMVASTLRYGALQKLLIETDRTIKDMLGIHYDDSTV